MHILVTNDDGIYAPGIFALQAALRTIPGAKVTIMAPQDNQSAVGHRKTLFEPLRIKKIIIRDGVEGYATSGSPADSIAMALLGYIEDEVDLVVSGINRGPNLAQDITYSGTVTAAMESVLFGVPAIAMSLDSFNDPDYGPAARFAARLAPLVVEKGLPELTLLNVNVPVPDIKGVRVTRQGRRRYHDKLDERIDPMGRPYYWIGGGLPTGDTEDVGTDVWAIDNGYISISAIWLDLTARDFIGGLKGWGLDDWPVEG